MTRRFRLILAFSVFALLATACEQAIQGAADGISGEGGPAATEGVERVTDAGGTGGESGADVSGLPTPVGPTHVTPASIGTTVGVGVVAPAPTAVVDGHTIDTPGAVLENVVVEGCLSVTADDVTIRNVDVRCTDWYPIKVEGAAGTVIEHSRIDCGGQAWKAIYFDGSDGFAVDSIEVTGCDDGLFVDGGSGTRMVRDSVFHQQSAGRPPASTASRSAPSRRPPGGSCSSGTGGAMTAAPRRIRCCSSRPTPHSASTSTPTTSPATRGCGCCDATPRRRVG